MNDMKKLLYILTLALLPLAVKAGEVKVTTPSLFLKNDTLTISLKFDVSDVMVNSTQAYAYTPVLNRQWRLYSLPPVVVSGKKKFKMRKLDRKIARNGEYKEPYTVIYGKDPKRNNIVDYTVQIPYQQWMSEIDMIILQEDEEACVIDLPEIEVYKPEPVIVKPQLPQKGAFCESCASMVSFLTPEDKPLKTHSVQNTLYIEYPTGGTEFKIDYRNNGKELQKLQNALNPLTKGDLIIFKGIHICGYASPDGSVKTNDRMATKRAESFGAYLKGTYNFADSIIDIKSGGEDWDELIRLLNEKQPAYAAKALEIISKYDNLDVRESKLKTGLGAANYRAMTTDLFPSLRRLSISVDYEIREVRNTEAAQLIYTNPKMLSLQEMFDVAKLYKPGSKEYREVYEIAVTNYPTDIVANINAASALIIYGDFERARNYMNRVKDDPRAWNNMGVLAWLEGETEVAKVWFEKAMQTEPEKAKANLEKMAEY